MDIENATANKIGIMGEPWVITTNSGEAMYEMPGKLTEQEIMAAIHMARYFAKEAFTEAMRVSNNKHSLEVEGILNRGQVQIDALNTQVTNLSNELLKQMEGEE